MPSPITVLVVDDSALMRRMVTEILTSDPAIQVVGQARDGADALSKLEQLKPDVVTLDVEMPIMDGVTALDRIMRTQATPTIMLSSLTQAGAETTLRCLERGAVDFVGKPSGAISLNVDRVAAELIEKVKIAASVRLGPIPESNDPFSTLAAAGINRSPEPFKPEAETRVLLIGSSTGGPRALQAVVPALPAEIGIPIVIVQHMPAAFTKSLAKQLDAASAVTVREATQGDTLQPGIALVAPGGSHLVFDSGGAAHLTPEPPVHGVRPSVDVTLSSLAWLYGAHTLAVLMTGMGRDGARAMKTVRGLGGRTLAEDESTCVVFGMPQAAWEIGGVERFVPLPEIAQAIAEIAQPARRAA